MKQNGYVISRNKSKTTFFTSSSSYDKPTWVPLKEATSYVTAELADRAAKKLLNYGYYEVRLISLQEAIDFEFPDKQPNKTLDNVDNQGEMNAQDQGEPCPECGHSPCTCNEQGGQDQDIEDNVDIIISKNGEEQQPDQIEPEEEEHAWSPKRFMKHQQVMYKGEKHVVMDDAGTGVAIIKPIGGFGKPIQVRNEHLMPVVEGIDDDSMENIFRQSDEPDHISDEELLQNLQNDLQWAVQADMDDQLINQLKQDIFKLQKKIKDKGTMESFKMPTKPPVNPKSTENKTTVADLKSAPTINYKDAAQQVDKPDTDLTTTGALPEEEKIKVPREVIADLKAAIDSFSKQANFANTRDDAKAAFCMTTAEAFKTLLADLELSTVASMKVAQIQMTSWMSPIINNLPTSVQKFVYMAGRKPTLKNIFDEKWEEKRT